jgi:hypothetical protein
MPSRILEPWLGFLREVDRVLGRSVEVHCLGGFVLAVLWQLPRPTGDVDFIEVVPSEASEDLLRIAGKDSEMARRHRLYFHRVTVAEYPEAYASRLIELTPRGFKQIRLRAFEVHDLVLAKLGRNSPRDRADVAYLVRKELIDPRVLEERFEAELRPYALNEDRLAASLRLWLDEFFGPKGDSEP